jgi:hypothetical protein
MTRRHFLETAVAGSAASAWGFPALGAAPTPTPPVVRPITRGPKFHCYGQRQTIPRI